jgi:PAS domain S-box-containing protein
VNDCNAAALSILGRGDQEILGREVWAIAGLEKEGAFGGLAQRVAATREPDDAEISCPRPDGERLVQVRIFPIGRSLGVVLRDITEVREAARQLAETEAHYRELADGTPAAAWLSRADGQLEFVNQAMADALGCSREALLGEGWIAATDPDDRESMLAARAEAHNAPGAYHYEGRFRQTGGELRIIQLYGRPRFDRSGAFAGYAGMATDMTAARAAEDQQDLLISELNHRVKNTLATVQAVVSQTLRDAGVAAEIIEMVRGRLLSLSAAHGALNDEGWKRAALADIADAIVGPYADADRITVEGPQVWLEPVGAVSVAMLLHELVINAVKHGALSTPEGRVRLSWTRDGDTAALEWCESGGPPVAPPSRSGFGERLLGRLKADLAFAPSGVICRMRVPVKVGSRPFGASAED